MVLTALVGGWAPRALALEDTLTPAEKVRLKKYLPHSWKKLVDREHYHILAVGDSITQVRTPNLDQMPSLSSYYGTFAQKLARRFFYTGEVRDIDPREWEPAKFRNDMGPEVTIQNMGLGGRYIMHGMQRLWTDGMEYRPDLVTINFGVNDSAVAIPMWEWIMHMRKTVEYLQGRQIDVILLGPSNNMRSDMAENLALTPPYGSALKDLAQEMGVLYVDLGVPSWSSYFEIENLNAEEALQRTYEAARQLYIGEDGELDPLHPNVTGQRKMGEYIFQQLFGPPIIRADYGLEASFYANAEEGGRLELTLSNQTDSRREGYLMPLPIATATEMDETPVAFALEPGETITHSWQYRHKPRSPEEPFVLRYDLLAAHENFYRVPVLVMETRQSQLLTVKAVQRPLGVIWKVGRTDWVEDSFNVFALLLNSSSKPLKGQWKSTWEGQEQSGTFEIAPGENAPLQMTFQTTDDPNEPNMAGDLLTTFTIENGPTFRNRRALELVRNVTLGKTYTLNRWVKWPDREKPIQDEMVQFKANANAEGLGFEFTARNFDYHNVPGEPVIRFSVGIDAQKPEERATPGYYRKVIFDLPSDGELVTMDSFRRAHFGTGYNHDTYKVKETTILRSVSYPEANTRVLKVFFPRGTFMEHPWDLGNRKSWLGFDLNVTKGVPGEHLFGTDEEQTWTKNGLSYPNPMGMAMLELTTEPSPYWRLILE